MLHKGYDESTFALDSMEGDGVRPRICLIFTIADIWFVSTIFNYSQQTSSFALPIPYPSSTQCLPKVMTAFQTWLHLVYTLGTPCVHLGYTLGGVCIIRGKSINNLWIWNRKGKGDFLLTSISKLQELPTGARQQGDASPKSGDAWVFNSPALTLQLKTKSLKNS